MNASDFVDFSFLKEVTNNESIHIYNVLEIFLSTLPEAIDKMEHLAKNAHNRDEVGKQAHALKSSLTVIRIKDMHELLLQMEKLALHNGSMDEINKCLTKVIEQFKKAEPILLAEKEKHKPVI